MKSQHKHKYEDKNAGTDSNGLRFQLTRLF